MSINLLKVLLIKTLLKMGTCYGSEVPPGSTYSYGTGIGDYGIRDADPITPGIQSTPGVVTPVGPPRVTGAVPPFGMGTSAYGVGLNPNSGVGFGAQPSSYNYPGFSGI